MLLFALLILCVADSAVPTCSDEATCEVVPFIDSAKAGAMLQIRSAEAQLPAVTLGEAAAVDNQQASICISPSLQAAHNQAAQRHADNAASIVASQRQAVQNQSVVALAAVSQAKAKEDAVAKTAVSDAAPAGTKEFHVESNVGFEIGDVIAISSGAPFEEFNKIEIVSFGSLILESLLKFDHDAGASVEVASIAGAVATLDGNGFKAVTALCCPSETEQFFNRLLDKMGLDVCSKPHVQGSMHWFTCVPDMDFQYVMNTIMYGNPCKYWTRKGTTCPVLSPTCAGNWCR